ncbi:MAG: GNAT family N-acetyltransferase [Hespellia sp.]|nr:GNAT family N-acetyltransferase [Hespellia sp.]
MELRKLEQQEHIITRALWESVFKEDTKAFLDYYYSVKTKKNEIYVIDEDADIRAMLQLNPYRLKVEDVVCRTHYIIGVATQEAYRGRKMMQKLLLQAMQDMYRRKEPFTFLMPAAEAIYTPYDFRFVYKQRQRMLCGKKSRADLRIEQAEMKDAGRIAVFARKVLKEKYQVYAVRNKEYYETMIQEQASEGGHTGIVMEGRKPVGILFYTENEIEIMEPLFLDGREDALYHAIYELTGDETTKVPVIAWEEGGSTAGDRGIDKPVIMARILHIESFLKMLKTIDGQPLCCSFAIIDPWMLQNNRILKMEYVPEEQEMRISDTEDSDGVFTIDAFTSLIFGYRTMEEIEKDDGVLLTEKLRMEFQKIDMLNRIFLNEFV